MEFQDGYELGFSVQHEALPELTRSSISMISVYLARCTCVCVCVCMHVCVIVCVCVFVNVCWNVFVSVSACMSV